MEPKSKRKGITRRRLLGNVASLGVVTSTTTAFGATHENTPIQRDFTDPYLELIRLLHEASEIEHDLMVQYLYGAFSVKPSYAEIVGGPAPNSSSLLGVIIEEMQHLGAVNRLLVELGASPVLTREDFPYESDIYPFPFELSGLSQVNLARFTYCESSPDTLPSAVDQLQVTLGNNMTPNHVGHLYDAVIGTLHEVKNANAAELDYDAWFEGLDHIKSQGEVGHFQFFQSLYESNHPRLRQVANVWNLPASDENAPCYEVPVNPTAYAGHPNCIQDPELRALAWLGNLNYWCMLSLLDTGYRQGSQVELALAQAVMLGPLMSLSQQLPPRGAAVPFDPLSMGFEPGLNATAEQRFTRLMLTDARDFARSIENLPPGNFSLAIHEQLLRTV
jgi:hypothetical protein